MIEFANWWVVFLLPLPLLVYWFAPRIKKAQAPALHVPFYGDLIPQASMSKAKKGFPLALISAALIWLLMLTSAADPRWQGEPIPLPAKGRNLMMAVDLSGSMEERDFQVQGRVIDRLTATKAVAGQFIEKRKGDRLGLILFADQAFTQTPLTFDTHTVRQLLDEAVLGLAGQNTAIGDAIALAVKKMDQTDEKQKILILLTDGENTAGNIEPIKAAELAAEQGVKIYTIGIGSATPQRAGLFGALAGGSQLDEKTLQRIASLTGGQYFRASNIQELSRIYALLDGLEPVEQSEQYFRPQISLYYWPLLLATGLLVLMAIGVLFTRRQE